MSTSEGAYTLAMYRVKSGHEDAFISEWNKLAGTLSSLPHPPLWGTLIRNTVDRTLFYSFGPWEAPEHVKAMRENSAAGEAFMNLHALCTDMTPGDYEMVTHVDVTSRKRA